MSMSRNQNRALIHKLLSTVHIQWRETIYTDTMHQNDISILIYVKCERVSLLSMYRQTSTISSIQGLIELIVMYCRIKSNSQ